MVDSEEVVVLCGLGLWEAGVEGVVLRRACFDVCAVSECLRVAASGSFGYELFCDFFQAVA